MQLLHRMSAGSHHPVQREGSISSESSSPAKSDIRALFAGGRQLKSTVTQRLSASGNFADMMLVDHRPRADSSHLLRIVEHVLFRFFIQSSIFLSAVQLGLATDFQGQNWDDVWLITENLFCAIFALEMILKLVAHGADYFRDRWNLFDFLIAWVGILDTWVLAMAGGGQASSKLAIIRIFRLSRLLRIVKMLRVVPELMMVIEAIAASLRTAGWVFALLALVLYVWSIICVQIIGHKDAGYPAYDAADDAIMDTVSDFNNYLHFGTLSRSFLSLTNMVLLAEWPSIVRPIWEHQRFVIILFIVLVCVSFGVMNVIIGVIVEKTNEAMADARAEDEREVLKKRAKTWENLADLLTTLDQNQDERISMAEMLAGSENEGLVRLLASMEMPKGFTFRDLHVMLDVDADGTLTRDEFLHGMWRIIYGNDFQHQCMLHHALGMLRIRIQDGFAGLEAALKKHTESVVNDLRSELKSQVDQILNFVENMPVPVPAQSQQLHNRARRSSANSEAFHESGDAKSNNFPEIKRDLLVRPQVEKRRSSVEQQHVSAKSDIMLPDDLTLSQSEWRACPPPPSLSSRAYTASKWSCVQEPCCISEADGAPDQERFGGVRSDQQRQWQVLESRHEPKTGMIAQAARHISASEEETLRHAEIEGSRT